MCAYVFDISSSIPPAISLHKLPFPLRLPFADSNTLPWMGVLHMSNGKRTRLCSRGEKRTARTTPLSPPTKEKGPARPVPSLFAGGRWNFLPDGCHTCTRRFDCTHTRLPAIPRLCARLCVFLLCFFFCSVFWFVSSCRIKHTVLVGSTPSGVLFLR